MPSAMPSATPEKILINKNLLYKRDWKSGRLIKNGDLSLFLFSFSFLQPMKLSAASHRKLESFFRTYFRNDDFNLPEIYFYAGKLTRILTRLINVHGITFGRRIFIEPRLISFNLKNQPRLSNDLAAHEIAHTLQYRREGFSNFLYKYFSEYRKNLRKFKKPDAEARHQAYLNISFEIEAREIAHKFVEWKLNEK